MIAECLPTISKLVIKVVILDICVREFDHPCQAGAGKWTLVMDLRWKYWDFDVGSDRVRSRRDEE